MLKIVLSLISIIDKISDYFYERRLIQYGVNAEKRRALQEINRLDRAIQRDLKPSLVSKLRERYGRK